MLIQTHAIMARLLRNKKTPKVNYLCNYHDYKITILIYKDEMVCEYSKIEESFLDIKYLAFLKYLASKIIKICEKINF